MWSFLGDAPKFLDSVHKPFGNYKMLVYSRTAYVLSVVSLMNLIHCFFPICSCTCLFRDSILSQSQIDAAMAPRPTSLLIYAGALSLPFAQIAAQELLGESHTYAATAASKASEHATEKRRKVLIAHAVFGCLTVAFFAPLGAVLIRLNIPGVNVLWLHAYWQLSTYVMYLCLSFPLKGKQPLNSEQVHRSIGSRHLAEDTNRKPSYHVAASSCYHQLRSARSHHNSAQSWLGSSHYLQKKIQRCPRGRYKRESTWSYTHHPCSSLDG